jgi:hypothetical protein
MDDLALSYVAGVFDSSGSVHITPKEVTGRKLKSGKDGALCMKFQLFVGVTSTEGRLLEELQGVWGGHIYGNRIGEKAYLKWILYGTHAKPFIRDIRPYIKLKADDADIALYYISMNNQRGKPAHVKRQEMRDRLLDINKLRNKHRLHTMESREVLNGNL